MVFFSSPCTPELVPRKVIVVVGISHNECLLWCWDVALHHLNEAVDFSHVEKTICIHVGLVKHPHEVFFHVLFIIVVVVSFIVIVSFVLIVSFVAFMMVVVVCVHARPEFIPGEMAVIV